MTYKQRFINSVDEYKKEQRKLKAEYNKFNQGSHSEEEEKENTEKLEGLHKKEIDKLKTNLEEILEDKRKELGSKKETDLNKDYQLRLTNLLKVFKRDGTEMDEENIIKGLRLFTEDPMALDSLREALIESGVDKNEAFELIPLEKTDLTIAKLDSIKKMLNAKSKLSLKKEEDGYLGYEPLLDVLDDDFNYLG
ncbi:MAG: hypothetical protein ACTHW2_02430 [Tissierella sp.]|uniref:hypothetical protein n=1 Tax=Tissierella sp. TaxID=41274 RepID=UPI003F996E9F